jgi:hypothetical protein
MSGTDPSATATIVGTPNGLGAYTYTVTLNDTGTTTIGTFWFAWIPGQEYMNQDPSSIGSPTGWSAQVTTRSYAGGTGYAIEWTANSSASYIHAGGSSQSFTFTSTETPAQLAANSPFAPSTPTTTAFVYEGGALISPGTELVVTVECFRAGTHIRTPGGDVPIETLGVGDHVMTASGEVRPVVWTGRRHVRCDRYADPRAVWPVRVVRGALAPEIPHGDLWLSREHALCLNDVLVPVKCLINGTTIAVVPTDSITWHQLELATHDVVLAEGVPAETYLDVGDRGLFESQAATVVRPDAFGGASFIREAASCRPLVVTGPTLAAIRRRLDDRATRIAGGPVLENAA